MKFRMEALRNLAYEEPDDGFVAIDTEHTGEGRWCQYFTQAFSHDGRFFEHGFTRNSTESCDSQDPYDYYDDEETLIEVDEVFPREITMSVKMYKLKNILTKNAAVRLTGINSSILG